MRLLLQYDTHGIEAAFVLRTSILYNRVRIYKLPNIAHAAILPLCLVREIYKLVDLPCLGDIQIDPVCSHINYVSLFIIGVTQ